MQIWCRSRFLGFLSRSASTSKMTLRNITTRAFQWNLTNLKYYLLQISIVQHLLLLRFYKQDLLFIPWFFRNGIGANSKCGAKYPSREFPSIVQNLFSHRSHGLAEKKTSSGPSWCPSSFFSSWNAFTIAADCSKDFRCSRCMRRIKRSSNNESAGHNSARF